MVQKALVAAFAACLMLGAVPGHANLTTTLMRAANSVECKRLRERDPAQFAASEECNPKLAAEPEAPAQREEPDEGSGSILFLFLVFTPYLVVLHQTLPRMAEQWGLSRALQALAFVPLLNLFVLYRLSTASQAAPE